MKTFIGGLLLVGFLSMCEAPATDPSIDSTAIKEVVSEMENLYMTSAVNGASYSEIVAGVSAISKSRGVFLQPVTNEHFVKYYVAHGINTSSHSRVNCGCHGEIVDFEIVDEGNDNVGIVYKYANGAAYLSSWSGTSHTGGQCYQ